VLLLQGLRRRVSEAGNSKMGNVNEAETCGLREKWEPATFSGSHGCTSPCDFG
jgi:hypothetical protein